MAEGTTVYSTPLFQNQPNLELESLQFLKLYTRNECQILGYVSDVSVGLSVNPWFASGKTLK